ncbi:MAG: hypothetical protein Ta2E_10270 [Mycoplasmoidaceae bacterium]|nr:MAG: hypothetical protein Ta2E_10270 [Mycoplasmoidaceae bacterium]
MNNDAQGVLKTKREFGKKGVYDLNHNPSLEDSRNNWKFILWDKWKRLKAIMARLNKCFLGNEAILICVLFIIILENVPLPYEKEKLALQYGCLNDIKFGY